MNVHGPGIYILVLLKVLYLVRRFQPSAFTLTGLAAGLAAVVGVYRYRNGGVRAVMGGPLVAADDDGSGKDPTGLNAFLLQQSDTVGSRNPAVFAAVSHAVKRFLASWSSLVEETHPLFNQEYSNLLELKNEVLNRYHSLVHSLERDDMEVHSAGMKRLKTLLNDGLNSALTANNRRNQRVGITTETQFHHRGGPGGNDPAFDRRFSFFQV